MSVRFKDHSEFIEGIPPKVPKQVWSVTLNDFSASAAETIWKGYNSRHQGLFKSNFRVHPQVLSITLITYLHLMMFFPSPTVIPIPPCGNYCSAWCADFLPQDVHVGVCFLNQSWWFFTWVWVDPPVKLSTSSQHSRNRPKKAKWPSSPNKPTSINRFRKKRIWVDQPSPNWWISAVSFDPSPNKKRGSADPGEICQRSITCHHTSPRFTLGISDVGRWGS